MKKTTLLSFAFLMWGWTVWGQTTVSQDIAVLGSYGLGAKEQAINSLTEPGTYTDKKNGYSFNSNLSFASKVPYFFDILVKLNAKSRIGSPYLPLQLTPATVQAFAVTVDSAWARFNVLNVLGLADPFNLYVQAGKYQTAALNLQKVSQFGTESALNMLKTANALNTGIELTYKLPDEEDVPGAVPTMVSFQAVSALTTDEGIARLYDTDGSQADHGEAILGGYAPQVLATLRLTNWQTPFGTVGAETLAMVNGAGIYSGASFGASALVSTVLIPETLTLPVGLGLAYYDKNIDVLAGSIGTDNADKTIDLRGTLRAGLGTGIHYLVPQELSVDLNLAASYTQVSHIYRDALSLIGFSADAKAVFADSYVAGAGVILGTIGNVDWKSKAGVSTSNEYKSTFRLAENFGYEAYTGLIFGTKGSLTLGVNNNKGLAMNYGLQSLKDGEYKFRQKGTASADKLYETSAVYLKASFQL